MMDAMGVIYAVESEGELLDITRNRSLAAIPVGGRYRIIDFILSNMVNSGIRNVGVITQSHYSSLMGHLGPGKEWDLNRKRDGLFILSPYINRENGGWYRGSADALHSAMGFIRRSEQRYVIITGSNVICSTTFDDALDYHIRKGADITVMYKENKDMPLDELRKNTLLKVDEEGRVKDMEIRPSIPGSYSVSMKMYIVDRLLLEYLVEECVAHGDSDFVKDIMIRKQDSLKIYGYRFKGYAAFIDSILSFYRHNMDLLNPDVRNELFLKSGHVHTRVKDEFPALYSENARVNNCLVADGCVIEGEVENCVLFRGVKIYKGAKVKDSIIMQDSEILENAILENVILDKEVIIKRGKRLTGQKNYPTVIGKGTVI